MRWIALVAVLACGAALAGEVVISMPREVMSASADGAKASVQGLTVIVTGEQGQSTSVGAELKGGLRVVGVDMGWYRPVTKAQELSDEDRKEIAEILTVPSFYDRAEILRLTGDADHATALVQLVRDRDFHAGKNEVIWRAELWYFEFASGGWVKVAQQNKVLDRQRFESRDAYQAYTRNLRFVPELGAIEINSVKREITINETQMLKVGTESGTETGP